jgi:hypothetical protein
VCVLGAMLTAPGRLGVTLPSWLVLTSRIVTVYGGPKAPPPGACDCAASGMIANGQQRLGNACWMSPGVGGGVGMARQKAATTCWTAGSRRWVSASCKCPRGSHASPIGQRQMGNTMTPSFMCDLSPYSVHGDTARQRLLPVSASADGSVLSEISRLPVRQCRGCQPQAAEDARKMRIPPAWTRQPTLSIQAETEHDASVLGPPAGSSAPFKEPTRVLHRELVDVVV